MPRIRKVMEVSQRIRGFFDADTGSQIEGWVSPGEHPLIEFRENYPNSDTDYALIVAEDLNGEDTWICCRWKNSRYAEIKEISIPDQLTTVEDDDHKLIDEEKLVRLLPDFYRFSYTPTGARYPYPIDNVSLRQAPPYQNNCCTFVEALVAKAWEKDENAAPLVPWSAELHRQMMIMSSDDFFSPITALLDSDIAVPVNNPDNVPAPWTIVQGWRKRWSGGHTMIIVSHHAETDKVLTLESNSAFKLNGVGFRGLGNIADFNGHPPQNWWEDDNVWTWERICHTYRYRRQCVLKVRHSGWAL